MKYEKELQVALKIAQEAGNVILEIYNKDYNIDIKSDASPVTEADLASNQLIDKTLRELFPEDGILSEEFPDDGSRKTKKRFWVIDPLDGTKEFIKRNDEFAINIALVEDGEVVLGVIHVPVQKLTYYGIKGFGAYKTDEEKVQKLMVSNRTEAIKLLVSRSHMSEEGQLLIDDHLDEIDQVKPQGSSIKACLIAEGLYDVYYNFGRTMKWDTAAMEPIVKEAGGIIKTIDNQPIDYLEDSLKNKGFYIINQLENFWL